MSYVVLARKLRPNRFEDLIGQETISRTLRNAVTSGRVAHAFLFSGSRGVGKTSAARILTKALNCLAPEEGNPCGKCGNCIEITENASPDVYEIDAASNRGIENIRELRDNVQYAPAQCRYKVYIIDEAHMLTLESFYTFVCVIPSMTLKGEWIVPLKCRIEGTADIGFLFRLVRDHRILSCT